MKKEQIKKLKELMAIFRNSQGEDKEVAIATLFAYLDGVLDGVKTE